MSRFRERHRIPARSTGMLKKATATKKAQKPVKVTHPGMMGDGTEEQNLGQRGNPSARIKKKEVAAAFGQKRRKK
jgi:hypothetical protein